MTYEDDIRYIITYHSLPLRIDRHMIVCGKESYGPLELVRGNDYKELPPLYLLLWTLGGIPSEESDLYWVAL